MDPIQPAGRYLLYVLYQGSGRKQLETTLSQFAADINTFQGNMNLAELGLTSYDFGTNTFIRDNYGIPNGQNELDKIARVHLLFCIGALASKLSENDSSKKTKIRDFFIAKVLKNSSQKSLEGFRTRATTLQSWQATESIKKFINKILSGEFKSEKKLAVAVKATPPHAENSSQPAIPTGS